MSDMHPAADRSASTASAADRSGPTRADRLVRPEVAAHYVNAGDRLGAVLIGLAAAIRVRSIRQLGRLSLGKHLSIGAEPMGTWIRKWLQTRRYRQIVRRLTGLSPSELHDLGIARGDIDRLARKASQH
jgi:uncharacterized protein YjiS (DUF1127 family)